MDPETTDRLVLGFGSTAPSEGTWNRRPAWYPEQVSKGIGIVSVVAALLTACGGGGAATSGAGGAVSTSSTGGAGGSGGTADHCPQADESANARVFAMNHRLGLADADSYTSFRAAIERPLEKVLPCLRSGISNVLLYPADFGRLAMLIGSRGEAARKEGDEEAALEALEQAYQEQIAFFALKHPKQNVRQHLLLATANVVWRATAENWSRIAKQNGVWVLGQVHSPTMVRTAAPYLVELLSDPDDPKTGQVFYPSTTHHKLTTLLFDPKGKLVARWNQVATSPQQQQRELSAAGFASLRVAEGPFGNMAIVAGADALVPGIYDRLDALGAAIVFQPLAVQGWPTETTVDAWQPDRLVAGGWLATQHYAGIESVVASVQSGKVFDVVYDGQAFVTAKAKAGTESSGLIGQTDYAGYWAVAPWHAEDPKAAGLAERRATLVEQAAKVADSGAYQQQLQIVDLRVGKPEAVTVDPDSTKPTSVSASEGKEKAQSRPTIASDAQGNVVLAWQEGRGGETRVHAMTSQDGGLSFGEAAELVPNPDFPQERRRPHVCMHADGRTMVVFQEGRPGYERIVLSRRSSGGEAFGELEYVDLGGSPQWQARCGFLDASNVGVVFVDMRSSRAKVRFAKRAWFSASFDTFRWVDEGEEGEQGLLGQQLQPAIANDAGHIVYSKYDDSGWAVYSSRWNGQTLTLAEPVRLSDAGEEVLHSAPRIAVAGDRVTVAYNFLDAFAGQSDIAYRSSLDQGATWGDTTWVAGGVHEKGAIHAGGQAWARSAPVPLQVGDSVQLFFQGMSDSKSALYRMNSDGTVERVDDTGAAANWMGHPVATRVPGATLFAWEDTRDGKPRIYLARVAD